MFLTCQYLGNSVVNQCVLQVLEGQLAETWHLEGPTAPHSENDTNPSAPVPVAIQLTSATEARAKEPDRRIAQRPNGEIAQARPPTLMDT